MTIKHHLDDRLLMAYSAGQLPEAFNLVVATHLSLCDECRARAGSFDAIGGAMLEDCEAAPMSSVSLEATLARIARDAKESIPAPRPPARRQARRVLPDPLHAYVGGDLEAVRWRRIGGGVRQAILPTSAAARVRLLHIPAGAAVPDHGHRGTELTLVLQGAFRDEVDRFARGDIEIAGEELEHTPVAEPGEDCICLAATDAPLRFNAFLPRALQSFLRI
jgi:putative transcriptional regulator